MAEPESLRITIVGGGIGGLAAAIGLRRNGHHVTVYEKYSRRATQLGAAIHICPNANAVLRSWGIYAELFGANLMSRYVELSQEGATMKDFDLTEANKRWPHPWHLVQRDALHQELKRIASSERGVGLPVVICHGRPVESVIPEEGSVLLDKPVMGVKADVVIGADGVHSTMRRFVQDIQPFAMGKSAYRFMMERSELEEDERIAPLVSREGTFVLWYGDETRMVMYPCDSNQTLNFVGIHPSTHNHREGHTWNNAASIKQVFDTYKDFDPRLKAIVEKADATTDLLRVWKLLDMEKLETWTSGRLALMGDAAHPFLPFQAQGAAQAIEDAAALSIVLPKGTPPEEVPERLKLYESIRAERAHRIQEYSRMTGQDRVNGEAVFDMRAFEEYNFNHNELANSAATLREWEMARKVGSSIN